MATLTAIFQAQDNLSKAMANAGNAGSKTSGIMQKLGKIGSVAMKGIITAVTAAGTALLAFGKKAVNVGMSYEKSMSQVMATMGLDKSTDAGQEAYETLAAAAEHMGATTAFSTTQAADALNYLALAGYDAQKAAAALPSVLYLAGAGNMELARASDMLTDAMSALQIEATQENLTEFSDKLAKTASSSNTSVTQLGDAVLAVGGTAANLKGGVTELTASLGILADAGIKGAEGGTHLRNMINSLQSGKNKDAVKLFKKMGFSAYDAEGNMRSLGDQFKDINAYMEGMSGAEVDSVLRTIFNKTDLAAARAMLAATSNSVESLTNIVNSSLGESGKSLADYGVDLSDLAKTFDPLMTQEQFAANMMQDFGLDAETAGMIFEGLNSVLNGTGTRFDELTEKIDDSAGACEQMYRTMLDNLQGDVDIFNSTVEALYIEIFKSTNETLRDLVQTGTGYMQRLIEAFQTGGFSGLASELGNVLGDAITVLMGYVPSLINAGVSVVSALVDSIGNNADTITSAAVDIAIQLGSAILQIVPKLVSAFGKLLSSAGNALITSIPKVFKAVPDKFYNAIGLDKKKVIKSARKFATGLKKTFSSLFKGDFLGAIDGIGTIFNIDSKTISNVKSTFSKVSGWASTTFSDMKSAFSEGYKSGGLFGGIKGAFTSLKSSISNLNWKDIGSGLWNKIVSGISATGDWIKEKIGYAPDTSWSEIGKDIWNKIVNGISATGDWIKKKIGYTPDTSWEQIGKDIWEKIVNGITATGDWLKEKIGYTPDDSWKTIGADLWNKIKTGVSDAVTGAGDWLKNVLGYTPDDSWKSIGADIWGKIKTGVSETVSSAGDWLKGVLGYTPDDSWKTIGSEIWTKIKTGVSDAVTGAGDWLKGLLGYSPDDSWKAVGSDLWGKIKSGISEAVTGAGDWLKGALGYTPDESWKTIGADIWNKIKSGVSDAVTGAGDWLKGVLGYTPDDSWKTIGTELWTKIKSGVSEAVTGAGDWLKGALGYTPDDSWKSIGEEIWGKIKSGLESAASEGGALGAVASALESALETAGNIVTQVSAAIETLQSNGTVGTIWSSVQSIVESILNIVKQCVSAFTGVGDGLDIDTSGIQNGLVSAVEAISAAVQGMASGLEWISKAIESLNNAGALAPILEGIGAAIATYFTASAIMNVVNFFKAFSAGQAIFAALNPHILAIAAAVAGLIALISWAHNQVKLEDKTWGDYKEFDLQEIELQADATLNPKVTNGEEAMQAINDQIAQMVERGTFGEDVGARLSEMFSQYITPEGMDWEAWYETGHSAAMDLLNGISEGMESSTEMPNPADDIVQTMNQTFESVTGQSIDFSSMYSGMDTAADQAASDALATLNGIASDMESSGFETAGSEAAQGYAQGLQNGDTSGAAAAVVTATEEAVRGAQQSGSPAAAFMPIGAEAAQGYGMGLQQEDVASYAEAFATAAMAAVTAATQAEASALTLEAEGINTISTFAAGMTAGSPLAVAVMTATGVAIKAVAQAVNLTAQGSNMLRTLTAGMNSGRSAAVASARTTGSSIRSAFSSISLTSVGSNIMRGLLNGMNSMFSSLLSRAKQMASQLKQTIQSGMQVHSPSRFTEWVGQMTGQGLIDGIEAMTSKAVSAASNMVSSVSDTFTPSTASVSTQASVSPYEALGGNSSDASSSTNERHIVLDIRGGGRIEVSGLTKEQAIDLIAEQLKPQLQNILANEIFEGGNGVYEF